MKIKQEHFNYMRDRIRLGLNGSPGAYDAYRSGDFPNADRVKDINKRFRWDCLNAFVGSHWVCDNLYPYVDDSHIDTALRRIVDPL